jgi:hypothetical protein
MNPSPETSAPANGERKLRAQEVRRATPFVLMLLLGFAIGLGLGLSGAGEGRLTALPPTALWAGVGLIAVAAGALTVVWIRRMDEVEVADLLWSSFLGLQVFAIGAPCWELLAAAGAAPPVNRHAVYVGTFVVTALVHLWRRFRRA